MNAIRHRRLHAVLVLACAGLCQAAAAAPQADVKVLNDFGAAKEGHGGPWSEFVLAADGRYYGTTCCGGKAGNGSVFATDLQGHVDPVHTFRTVEGNEPSGPLAIGPDGALYGTAFSGGTTTYGTAYRIALDGSFTLLHTFDSSDGDGPHGLLLASDGAFYGVASLGGTQGAGVVFRITPAGGLTVVHDFGFDAGGSQPTGRLLQLADGTLVGVTTSDGGKAGGGTVFRLAVDGTFSVIASFGTQGARVPAEGVVDGGDGWLYGLAQGGSDGLGALYRVNLAGKLETLYSFAGGPADGATPQGRLTLGSDGALYGVTQAGGATGDGSAFRFTLAKGCILLHSFDESVDGARPQSAMLEVASGHFLGAAPAGGPAVHGDTWLLKLR